MIQVGASVRVGEDAGAGSQDQEDMIVPHHDSISCLLVPERDLQGRDAR